MNLRRILSFSLLVACSLFLFDCTDNNIEGTSSATVGFKITKTKSSNSTINTGCYSSSLSKYGTNFTVTLEYTGTQKITGISAAYVFSNGASGNSTITAGSGYYDYNFGSSSSGTFRGTSASGAYVEIYPCIIFGATTSITYTYTITTSTGQSGSSSQTFTSSVTLTKPAGAN